MITVMIKNTKQGAIVRISGHAPRQEDGRDYNMACACVSSIAFSAYNTFRRMHGRGEIVECKLEDRPGDMYMNLKARRDHLRDVRCHIDMLRTGLLMVKEQFPGSIRFVG